MATESNEEKGRYLRYLEVITGSLDDKRRYREYKARVRRLPENWRTAVEALERYLMHFGPMDGAGWISMYEDLADLVERSVADGTPVRDVFGEDPVEFVEAFMANYPAGRYRARERRRFTDAVRRAAGEAPGTEDEAG
ncbi:hypothetical protein Sru01_29190 [Sphaerisporangium rufum]|uniref:DUF1048 domain-containing protein n=1 Tax=Sphaerisporangium rufum TaxID=1381558 RepID=A0A919V0X0_9ACTN|nr:DUF1048 domain-containing protein [Sphaerisporangium rufum]GII77937.1 hypothetical protein Sru01_29190 [Sphaerisporangium rufum]